MKRFFLCFFLPLLAFALLLNACSSGSGEVKGVIKSMVDSTQTMVADIDGSEGVFFFGDALLQNGAVMPGDSVVINYKGSLSRAVAVTIRLIPRQGTIVDLEELRKSEQPLVTKPASKESVENFEKFKNEAAKAKSIKSE